MNLHVLAPGVRRRTVLLCATVPWVSGGAFAAPSGADAAQFFGQEETLSAQLAPDGRRVAIRTVASHGGVMLSVLDLATLSPIVLHSQEAADATDVIWANHERLLFSIEERRVPQAKRESGPGLFAINADGTGFRQLVERQELIKFDRMEATGISGAVPTGAAPKGVGAAMAGQDGMGFKQIADAPNIQNIRDVDTDRVLPWNTYLLDARSGSASGNVFVWQPRGAQSNLIEVMQLNLRTGRVKHLDDLANSVVSAHIDPAGSVRAVVVVDASGRRATLWRDAVTSAWRTLADCAPEAETDWAIKYVDGRSRMYVSARRGKDTLALWRYDVGSARWSDAPLAQSPQFDVDAEVIQSNGEVVGYRFTIDAEVTQWVDPAMQSLQQQIDKALPRTVNRITVQAAGNGPWVLIEAFADVQPTLFLLFNRETRKFSRLGSNRPRLVSKDQAGTDLVRVKARDGLEVPAWLTMPAGSTKKNLPMVVLLQDGPFKRAQAWQWMEEVQFLAARGYIVLQPQVRGTKGLGLRHFQSGWRQWGKAMQSDVADAASWAIAQGLADPKRVAIVGAGFGGYASLMGLVQNPELFRCAVSWAGITELGVLHAADWRGVSRELGKDRLTVVLGDRVADAAELRAHSPMAHVASIRQPVLLAQGDADVLVPLAGAEAFRTALQARNSSVDWVVYKDEGHDMRLPANRVDFWNRTAQFLDKQLAAN